MPKSPAAPSNEWSEWLEDPIRALGNLVRAGIIGYLRRHGPATRAQIAGALELPVPTVAAALQALTRARLLVADPPAGEARRGQRIRYAVDDERVSRMYLQLGYAIGET